MQLELNELTHGDPANARLRDYKDYDHSYASMIDLDNLLGQLGYYGTVTMAYEIRQPNESFVDYRPHDILLTVMQVKDASLELQVSRPWIIESSLPVLNRVFLCRLALIDKDAGYSVD